MAWLQKHQKVSLIGAVLVLVAFFSWQMWFKADSVGAYEVKKQAFAPSLLLSGEVISQSSALLSTPTSGVVVQRPVNKGDQVQPGQLILQLDDRQAVLARDRAMGAVQTARSNLQLASTVSLESATLTSVQADLEAEQAQRQYDRTLSLAQAGAVSQVDLEAAVRNLQIAQERSKSARVALEALQGGGVSMEILQTELQQRQRDLAEQELLVAQCQVLAPTEGTIVELYAQPGELLQAGSQVALLSSSQQSRIRIKPDQRYAGLAALNNTAQIWIPYAPGEKWTGRVVFADPAGNADLGSLTAELSLEQNVPELYPGRLVSVQLFGAPEPDALIISDAYLTVAQGKTGVWIGRAGRAHFVEVQTGLRTAEGVQILSGLSEGDLVLAPLGLQEGKRVSPQIKGTD